MAWTSPSYSSAEVDSAGSVLISTSATPDEKESALLVVSNWRSCHAFPLNTMQMTLRRKAAVISTGHPHPWIAQRIKRLPAIIHKLQRLPLKLSVVQDIGGCRAIMANIKLVRDLRTEYGRSHMRHSLVHEDDYLANPKKSGYRGIHLIYQYFSDRNSTYNGKKIEIQLRSRQQHAWATAVETAGLFSAQYLKSSQGDRRWLRFFALMGSIIALKENSVIVPGTPDSKQATVRELKELERELGARRKLLAYGEALTVVEPKYGSFFLLQLNSATGNLKVTGYSMRELKKAEEDYSAAERSSIGDPGRDAVLVSVESVKLLRAAYPNYYLDTRRFVQVLDLAVRGQ